MTSAHTHNVGRDLSVVNAENADERNTSCA
jgi:hypothetical protein